MDCLFQTTKICKLLSPKVVRLQDGRTLQTRKDFGSYYPRFLLERNNWMGKWWCSILYYLPTGKSPMTCMLWVLNSLQVPYAAWASTLVEFITQLPKSAAYTQIIVVVDWFTKMTHLMGLHESTTTKDVAEAFLKGVWKLLGLHSEIILDMDVKFGGECWE